MAIRIIEYTVGADSITPATLQPGGAQGEHKATLLRFKINDELWETLHAEKEVAEGSTIIYRIVGVDGLGNEHPSDVSVLDEPKIEYYLERCLTKYGGKAKVQIVITLYKGGVAVSEPRTPSVELQLKASPVHCGEHEDCETVSALAYGAKESATRAEGFASSREKSLADTKEAAKFFEKGAEVIFQGGGAASSFKTDMAVDTEIIEGSSNPVAGGAVYNAWSRINKSTTEGKTELETLIDNKIKNLSERIDNSVLGIKITDFKEFEVAKVTNDDNGDLGSGKWRYLKLSNGYMICWGTFAIVPSAAEPYTTGDNIVLYKSEIIRIKLPFVMGQESFCAGLASNSYTIGNTSFQEDNASRSNILKFRYSRAYKNKSDAGITRLLVIGKIEEETTNE